MPKLGKREIDLPLLILLLLPWIDAFASILGPILSLYKLCALGLGFLLVYRHQHIYSLGLLIAFAFFLLFQTLILAVFTPESAAKNFNYAFRLLYPFLFVALFQLEFKVRNNTEQLIKLFAHSVCLAALSSLFLGSLTGFGGEIAGRGALLSGSKGFYIGANEVGVILCIAVMLIFLAKLPNRFQLVYLLSITISGVIVFTKSSLAASLLSIILLSLNFRFLKIVFFIMGVEFIYLASSKIDKIMYFIENTFFRDLLVDPISFVLRGRQTYIDAFFESATFHENFLMSFKQVIFGNGDYTTARWIGRSLEITSDAGIRTTFEMDFFDLLSGFGVLGVAFILVIIWHCAKKLITFQADCRLFIKICVIAILAHSFLAGHVLFSLQVTVLLAITYILCNSKSSRV